MRRRLLNIIVFFIPVLLLLRALFFCIELWQSSYTQFLHQILQAIDRPDLNNLIREQYFPEAKYHGLQVGCSIVLLLCALLYILMLYAHRRVTKSIHQLLCFGAEKKRQLISLWQSTTLRARILFLLILVAILIRSLYYVFYFPIQYDEAWNANLFLRKSWYYSLSAYNNYPLHNLCTWLFVQGFGDSVFVLRLPSVLAGLSVCMLIGLGIYAITRRENLALVGILLFACMPVSVFYMMYSRGVMFELGFALLSFLMLHRFTQQGINHKKIFLLAFVQALGVLSMLSHIYFCMALSVALLIWVLSQRLSLRFFFSFLIEMFLLCVLFLLPMLLGTGIRPGWQAAVSPHTISIVSWWTFIKETSSFVSASSWFLPISFLLLPIVLYVTYIKQKVGLCISILLLSMMALLFVIPASTHVLPPPRVFGCMVLIPWFVYLLFFAWIESKSLWGFGLSLAVCISGLSYQSHTHPFLNWSYQLDKQVAVVADKMGKAKIHTVYNDCRSFDYFIPGISYYAYRLHEDIHFASSAPNSTRYQMQDISRFNCVVVDQTVAPPPGFFMLYRFDDIVVYSK